MKSKLNTVRSAAYATAILAYLSPQAAFSDTITVPVFEQISPIPTIYNFGFGNDFTVIEFSAPGDVTGSVQAIPFLGCAAADFAGFSAGSIALITRGTCSFADKIANAAAAGAGAALISNNVPGGAGLFTAVSPTLIPALFTTQAIGDDLRGLLAVNQVTARVGVPVVESTSPLSRHHPHDARGSLLLSWRSTAAEICASTAAHCAPGRA